MSFAHSTKPIRFIRGGTLADDDANAASRLQKDELDGDEISSFYESLVQASSPLEPSTSTSDSLQTVEQPDQPVKAAVRTRRRTVKRSESVTIRDTKLDFTERDKRLFFMAATANNVQQVVHYLAHGMFINVVDQYGWTALMMAAAEGASDVVHLLLSSGADAYIEAGGRNAEALAREKRGSDVLKTFASYRASLENKQKETTEVVDRYCELCEQHYTEPNHDSSIAHTLKLNAKPLVGYSYGLSAQSFGYRLLKRKGWSEGSGLGRDNEGRHYPLRAKTIRDRECIGRSKLVTDVNEKAKQALIKPPLKPSGKKSYVRQRKAEISKQQSRIEKYRRLLS